ncbi:MAG: GNAT family N-acetyltransferase [Thermodesulfobacteriota bacterium]
MATTATTAAFKHPLDLTALKKTAETGSRECILIHKGGLDIAVDKLPSKGRASSHMQSIGLMLDPGQQAIEADMAGLFDKGVKLVLWKSHAAQTDAQKKSLWVSSRAGIWNHLIFLIKKEEIDTGLLGFALNNPNIVHSYSFDDRSIAPLPATVDHLVESLPRYGKVKPLPGTPIWKVMDTPKQLLCFLNTFGLKQVQKWLVMENTNEVHCLGGSIQYHYSRPCDLPIGFFEEICRMVESGGSVNMQKVSYNLEHAFLIGYAMEFDLIVGNSSLKHPRPEYIQSLNQNTGLDFSGFLERGYTSVRPEYRGMGMGTELLEGLTKRTKGKKLYSIISEDNLATQKIAIRNKTRKLTTFFSQKTGKQVGVWVKD